ncbi:MAG: hypothetical protein P8164_00170 [Gammaproteobacteria bacterium]|jgi:uncharacterized protein with HEPN domain
MIDAAKIAAIEEAGTAVLTLSEGVEKDEFLRSRLTRAEVRRQVRTIADVSLEIPAMARSELAEIAWEGWAFTARHLHAGGDDGEVLWRAVTTLIPATLSWLRVYRHNQPDLFIAAIAARE